MPKPSATPTADRSVLTKIQLTSFVEPLNLFKRLLVIRSTTDSKSGSWHFLCAVIVRAAYDYCSKNIEASRDAYRYLQSQEFTDHCYQLGLDDALVRSAIHDLERYCLKNRITLDSDQARIDLDVDSDRAEE